ncbi:MAG: hypothetical protein ACRDWH_07450 [Acidimicrobiia bacterium]
MKDSNPRPRGSDDHSRHDLDLVAAYADDDPAVDRAAAAELVGACPECRAEFDLQRAVKAWLGAAPNASLSESESRLIRDRVDRAIAQPTVVSLTPRRQRTRGHLWLRIGTAAAAVAVVAALGGLGNLGLVGSEPAFRTESGQLAAGNAEPTTAAAETTAAASATMFGAQESQQRTLSGGDADDVKREVEELLNEAEAPAADQSDTTMVLPPCWEEIEQREVLLSADSVYNDEPITIFVVQGDQGPQALVYRTTDCSLVDLD